MCVSVFTTDSYAEEASLSLTAGLVALFQSDTEEEEFNVFSHLK